MAAEIEGDDDAGGRQAGQLPWLLHGERAHHGFETRVQSGLDAIPAPQPAPQLETDGGIAGGERAEGILLLTPEGALQVHEMDAGGTGLREGIHPGLRRHFVEGGPGAVAFVEPHDAAFHQIHGGDELYGHGRTSFIQSNDCFNSLNPSTPDFSGWGWKPSTRPRPATAVKGRPWSAVSSVSGPASNA